ncbi:hypothetical protein FACS1894177_08340 [Bacteroidia bacterium]|nr:hypothetical protein FACS1894177_08340 [Bacteroidia bacterium]
MKGTRRKNLLLFYCGDYVKYHLIFVFVFYNYPVKISFIGIVLQSYVQSQIGICTFSTKFVFLHFVIKNEKNHKQQKKEKLCTTQMNNLKNWG